MSSTQSQNIPLRTLLQISTRAKQHSLRCDNLLNYAYIYSHFDGESSSGDTLPQQAKNLLNGLLDLMCDDYSGAPIETLGMLRRKPYFENVIYDEHPVQLHYSLINEAFSAPMSPTMSPTCTENALNAEEQGFGTLVGTQDDSSTALPQQGPLFKSDTQPYTTSFQSFIVADAVNSVYEPDGNVALDYTSHSNTALGRFASYDSNGVSDNSIGDATVDLQSQFAWLGGTEDVTVIVQGPLNTVTGTQTDALETLQLLGPEEAAAHAQQNITIIDRSCPSPIFSVPAGCYTRYIVYLGIDPLTNNYIHGMFSRWHDESPWEGAYGFVNNDQALWKGFFDPALATKYWEEYKANQDIFDLLCEPIEGPVYYVVIEGVQPGVYSNK
ncbi:hypothetical protein VNI00_012845 [Paramarasmius palmivorus]|uniref:Uncharacterized protein n=1 Tax=Paramarasmius palmivorus TaxID=297713 RepID=A0AAW0C666_9AGAR